ncbi:hypothetical protein Rhopal_000361-T1 [Rhodotorula paludigena]|uniref:NAD(P)-binding protein n=1 Tax=Rhodotorula paludigena TaxID=86838 RepID=A0AAV5GE90_9BASI|nr:hypothetical protein Rhopal_000361-T1 [Rhodotorula paludigena]
MLGAIAARMGYSNGRKWDPETGLPDLTGKVAVVTGANDGLGFITTQVLHKKGCKVYLACRREEAARQAIQKINQAHPGHEDKLVFVPFDLTELPTIRKTADTLLREEERLDIVVCNAGIMAWPYEVKNGVEVQFHLLPRLIETSKLPNGDVRVVSVSSLGHKLSPKPDFSSLDAANAPLRSTWHRYGQSKLANILFAVALQERVKGERIYVNSLHPGVIHTTLIRGPVASYGMLAKIANKVEPMFLMTPKEGAKTQIYLAASPEVVKENYRGGHFGPIASPMARSAYAEDKALAEQLWTLSENALKQLEHA